MTCARPLVADRLGGPEAGRLVEGDGQRCRLVDIDEQQVQPVRPAPSDDGVEQRSSDPVTARARDDVQMLDLGRVRDRPRVRLQKHRTQGLRPRQRDQARAGRGLERVRQPVEECVVRRGDVGARSQVGAQQLAGGLEQRPGVRVHDLDHGSIMSSRRSTAEIRSRRLAARAFLVR